MNRRTALLLTMLLGGFVPRRLFAQSSGRRAANRSGGMTLEPARPRRGRNANLDETEEVADAKADDEPTPDLPAEPGQHWRKYDITRYTGLAHSATAPQNAIVEWIFRRTGTAPWHGDKVTVLSASRTLIRAYHDAATLKMVDEVVERFVNAEEDILSIRVRIVKAADTRWRYPVFSLLTPVESGPQGQQIWTLKANDAALVLAQMQVFQGFKLLVNQKYDMVNGQTLKVETTVARGYTGGMQRESTVGLGYQPKAEQLEEGVTLRISPLLTFDGDALDAAIELNTNDVRSLHRTRVIAPREIGPSELAIDVPEASETRLTRTVKGWPLGQTLLISAGIQPGILQDDKNGFLNLRIPGTVPTSTEVLIFLEAEVTTRPKKGRGHPSDKLDDQ